jgi:flagellar assembly protein FliH
MRSTIMRGDTEMLSVVKPQVVLVGEAELLSARERAEHDGRESGYAAGLAAARAEMQVAAEKARLAQESAFTALDAAVAQARSVLVTEGSRLEHAAVELAFNIAQAVLGRELKLATSPGLEAIRRALAESPDSDGAVVRLNPADAQALSGNDQVPRGVTIVPDPSVGAGGCVLEVGAALVDARLETALERVRRVLDDAMGMS